MKGNPFHTLARFYHQIRKHLVIWDISANGSQKKKKTYQTKEYCHICSFRVCLKTSADHRLPTLDRYSKTRQVSSTAIGCVPGQSEVSRLKLCPLIAGLSCHGDQSHPQTAELSGDKITCLGSNGRRAAKAEGVFLLSKLCTKAGKTCRRSPQMEQCP